MQRCLSPLTSPRHPSAALGVIQLQRIEITPCQLRTGFFLGHVLLRRIGITPRQLNMVTLLSLVRVSCAGVDSLLHLFFSLLLLACGLLIHRVSLAGGVMKARPPMAFWLVGLSGPVPSLVTALGGCRSGMPFLSTCSLTGSWEG